MSRTPHLGADAANNVNSITLFDEVIARLDIANDRIGASADRLGMLKDRIYGPCPIEAGSPISKAEAQTAVQKIDDRISRLERLSVTLLSFATDLNRIA